MSILVVSVSHRSTSVGMLSRLAMDAASTAKLAEQLVASDHIDEAVVLSTCNRTELYTSVSRFHGGLDDAVAALAALAGRSRWTGTSRREGGWNAPAWMSSLTRARSSPRATAVRRASRSRCFGI